MNDVRVWNDNILEHSEKFKGNRVSIPAGKFIVMPGSEAVEFKGQFFPPQIKNGVHLPEGFKKIRLEEIEAAVAAPEPETFICQKCAFSAKSNAGLAAHTRANHLDSMMDDDARKELVGSE